MDTMTCNYELNDEQNMSDLLKWIEEKPRI